MRSGPRPVLIVVLALVVSGCAAPADPSERAAGDSGRASRNVPLPAAGPEAFRQAEAALRSESRSRAGLANLGPGALDLAEFMDRTGSFLLAKLPEALTSVDVRGGPSAPVRGGPKPLAGLPPPGMALLGTWATTTILFSGLMSSGERDGAKSKTQTTTDEVSVAGSPGIVTTTSKVTSAVSGSKVTLDVTMTIKGEVRDAASGATLFSIDSKATAKIEGEACPDVAGSAAATVALSVTEGYFAGGGGGRIGYGLDKSFAGTIKVRADDDATLVGVDIKMTAHEESKGGVRASGAGQSDLQAYSVDAGATQSYGAGAGGFTVINVGANSQATNSGASDTNVQGVFSQMYTLIGMSAFETSRAIEKAWRSGRCISVLVDPEGGEVDKDSVTTVTAKVKHKFEGNELDKPVEAALDGVKSIEPAGKKQKAPATHKYTAGSQDEDRGNVTFKSVSNRGIGETKVTFTVGGGWLISSVGTSTETVAAAGLRSSVQVSFKNIKVSAGKDNALSGSGPITLKGSLEAGLGEEICTAPIDRTFAFTLTGSLVGTGPAAVLNLKVNAATPSGQTLKLTCDDVTIDVPQPGEGNFYGFALGELELPAAGGTKSFDRSAVVALATVRATATVTVARQTR